MSILTRFQTILVSSFLFHTLQTIACVMCAASSGHINCSCDDVFCAALATNAEEMCELIDTTISAAVQHSLNNLKSDCEKVVAGIETAQAVDAKANSSNSSRRGIKAVLFSVCFLFSLVVPVSIALYKLETVFHVLTQLKGDDPESWVRLLLSRPRLRRGTPARS
jgi:hypothetical protein